MNPEFSYIGLGSNLDSPLRQLQRACKAIAELESTTLVSASNVYRSKPMGPRDQPDFLNAVLSVKTELSPHQLLTALQHIENRQQRERSVRWGPRTIDLDILLYGSMKIDAPELTIPHPGLMQRGFVLLPLAEIAPDLKLRDDTSVAQALARLSPGELTLIARSEELLGACS